MSVTDLTIAERIACAICWLSREPAKTQGVKPVPLPKSGMPDIAWLRAALVERHGEACDWCDYPPAKLIDLCLVDEGTAAYRDFQRLPALAQRTLVVRALHDSAA